MCLDERQESWRYEVTLSRDLLDALAEHYADHDDVDSVTDMLRQAARDVTGYDERDREDGEE